MLVSATEFKSNIGKYLSLVTDEDIFITKNGKNVAKLSSTKKDKVDVMKSLFGIIPNENIDLKQFKAERLAEKYENFN